MNTYLVNIFIILLANTASAQKTNKEEFAVIAYYSGDAKAIDSYPIHKLTQIIFSFCHLQGNKLNVDSKADTATIKKLVSLKRKYPSLKILLSLGGWGGCKYCSDIFASPEGRMAFSQSVNQLMQYFKTDGIDLDWEYPAIEGFPGHNYSPEDKSNFTELVRTLRNTLGPEKEISFAAGAFTKFLEQSIEWKEVMPLLNRVNLMTYDLANSKSPLTGHHTPIYSTPQQQESADHVVRCLDSIGIPRNKLVIGSAFYARIFEGVENINNGLNQPGKWKSFVPFRQWQSFITPENGYMNRWDSLAQAPYSYNAGKQWFVTYDDARSVKLKTRYAMEKGLQGIMFWELTLDKTNNGLLDVIYQTKKQNQ